MRRILSTTAVLAALWLLVTPALAVADDYGPLPQWFTVGTGLFSLAVAVVLLIEVIALRRFAEGAAIVQHISYVISAIFCLTAAALVTWITRFLPTEYLVDYARSAGDLLVAVAMVLLGAYFFLVRRTMRKFVESLTGYQQTATAEPERDGDSLGDDIGG